MTVKEVRKLYATDAPKASGADRKRRFNQLPHAFPRSCSVPTVTRRSKAFRRRDRSLPDRSKRSIAVPWALTQAAANDGGALCRPVHRGGCIRRRIFRHGHHEGLVADLVDDLAVLPVVGRNLRLPEHDDVLVDGAGALTGDAIGGDADLRFVAVDSEHPEARALAIVTGIAAPASHQAAVGGRRRLLLESRGLLARARR